MRLRSLPTATAVDGAVAALLCAVGEIEVSGWWDLGGIGVPDPHASAALEAVLVVLATAPLVWRRAHPFAAHAVVIAVLVVQVFALTPSVSLVAGLLPVLLTTFSVAAQCAWVGRIAGLTMALATQGVFSVTMPEERVPNELAFGLLVISGSWLLGVTLGHRIRRVDGVLATAERLTAEQQTLATRMLAEERTRIARELHDVIAHGVSVMGVQSAAARIVLDRDPDRAKDILLAVEGQARESIGELQRLLSVLRASDDATADRRPQPGLGNLPQLVDTVRSAGLRVELSVRGEPRHLPPGADLTAYRIVQEALTNTLKHAGPVAVDVDLQWATDELRIEIVDHGPPVAQALLPGHGLLGMRERTALYGGSLLVAVRPSGGIAVNANLPLAVGK